MLTVTEIVGEDHVYEAAVNFSDGSTLTLYKSYIRGLLPNSQISEN